MKVRSMRKLPGQGDREQEDQENGGDTANMEGPPPMPDSTEGVSKTKFIQAVDGNTNSGEIDELDFDDAEESGPSRAKVDGDKEDKRDPATQKRESLLKIFKEEDTNGDADEKDVDLSNGIKIRRDEEEDSGFELKTSVSNGKSPLIQELDTPSSTASTAASQKKVVKEKFIPFDFETAERVELNIKFIQQNDLVFLNIPQKGYNKEEDIRYALSADEIFIEIRDRTTKKGAHQVRRLCQTLNKPIDVGRSEIQLLVDFIVIKLAKEDKSASWSTLGFDVANFQIPKATQMKSNFLTSWEPEPVKEEEPEEEVKEEVVDELTLEEREEIKVNQIKAAMQRAAKA